MKITVLTKETKYGVLTFHKETQKFYLDSPKGDKFGSFSADELSIDFVYEVFGAAMWFGGIWGYVPDFFEVEEQVKEVYEKIKQFLDSQKEKFIFLDTETTGIDQDAEMLSIAIIDEEGNTLLDTYVTPTKHTEWPSAMAVNGITPEFIFSGQFPTAQQLEYKICEIIENRTIVMYGADFDRRFIKTPLYIVGSKTVCCMERFSDYMGEFDPKRNAPKRHKLVRAAEIAGHTWIDTPHGALADATATKAVWQFLDSENHTQNDVYL